MTNTPPADQPGEFQPVEPQPGEPQPDPAPVEPDEIDEPARVVDESRRVTIERDEPDSTDDG